MPGHQQDWSLGVRYGKKKTLYGFISAIPVTVRVKQQKVNMVEINFLCVRKELRNKGLGPVLIKEIKRRANTKSIWQAVYTAGVLVHKYIAKATYYHRSLNAKKLVEIGFNTLPP